MKQTETYNLKLIDRDDDFSPDALNDNAEAIDAALARVDAALATIPKIVYGTYKGNTTTKGVTKFIPLPFTPKLVYVGDDRGYTFLAGLDTYYYGGLALEGKPVVTSSTNIVEIVEGGFQVTIYSNTIGSNYSGRTYRYFAIG